MRAAFVALLLGSGCVCTPLSALCGGDKGPCPTESDLVKQGLQEAEKEWTTLGSCAGPTIGSTPHGSWVNPGALGLCGEQYFFSRTGRLLAKASCCEGECQEWGFGLRMKAGPVTRDLCSEAKASLILLGATAKGVDINNIVSTDGAAATRRPRGHWALPFGRYSVEYFDGGQQPLEVLLGSDGGLASPVSAPELEIGLLFHRPGAAE
jgi:hypothetical protein